MKQVNSKWFSLVSRMRQEARTMLRSNNDGVTIVTAHVLIDSNGNPLIWVVPNGKRVEPSKDAGRILLSLVKEL